LTAGALGDATRQGKNNTPIPTFKASLKEVPIFNVFNHGYTDAPGCETGSFDANGANGHELTHWR